MRIAHARSGDKGDTANIGVIGRSPEIYAWLRDHVTAALVKTCFTGICLGRVERHEVPNLWALNFLLEESLGGGGTLSLLLDAQGKTLSHALLRCEVEVPEALLATIRPEDAACAGELVAGRRPRRDRRSRASRSSACTSRAGTCGSKRCRTASCAWCWRAPRCATPSTRR